MLALGTPEGTEELMKKFPKMESISRIIGGELLANSQITFDNFRNLTPEQRYSELLEKRPGLCNRVPQYMLASYLGIQPESLSRIRKRMKDNKTH